MKKTVTLIIFFIFVFFIFSCEGETFLEEGIKEIVKEINVKLENAVGQEFNWGSPKAYSIFRAYFHADELIFINESYTYRKPAESANLYYFKDGTCSSSYKQKIRLTLYVKKAVKAKKKL